MAEQHEIMSKCYEEHRAVADEQSKLSSTQKVSKEKELREIERLVKVKCYCILLYYINVFINIDGKNTEVTG